MELETSPDEPHVLVLDDGELAANWPFLLPRLTGQLGRHDVLVRSASIGAGDTWIRDRDALAAVTALVVVDVEPTVEDIAAMAALEVVAGVSGGAPLSIAGVLAERGIAYVDGSRGRNRSRAEMAIGLMLAGLRQIATWHEVTMHEPACWPHPSWQYCDHAGFVNGTICGRDIVILGLDLVGQQIAELCAAFGARVAVVDPDADNASFDEVGARQIGLEDVVCDADIVIAAGGPRSPRLTADLVDLLPLHSMVVTVTPYGIDLAAVRRRTLNEELYWATDVFDTLPVPAGDPLLGHGNVVHTPGVAARTRDAMLTIADVLADNIIRVLSGQDLVRWDEVRQPAAAVSAGAAEVRR
ncbi:NAD(P)-dependent oxidoreductase [Nocardia brasiliensis]|uniref:NAD(P)-dependent oxidoreductase n=1 Tax=Nocardia brasiliensis TaxID=37326 RepID=UPI00379C9338